MENKFITYSGLFYTIEWYYDDRAKSEARDYFNELTSDRQRKFIHLYKLLADSGKIFNREKFTNEGDQVYAFKPSPDRFFCFFFDGSRVIITNAYHKKTQKMSVSDKKRALKNKNDYIKRFNQGTYYDKKNKNNN